MIVGWAFWFGMLLNNLYLLFAGQFKIPVIVGDISFI